MANLKGKHSGYFEGILQLREQTDEVLKFIDEALSHRDDVRIAKTLKVTNGLDLYFSSKNFLVSVGKNLFARFGGELKISKRLFSQDKVTSRTIYRVTVMFRPPKFKVGDVVKAKGHELRVKLMKKQILGTDVKSGEKVWFDYDDIKY